MPKFHGEQVYRDSTNLAIISASSIYSGKPKRCNQLPKALNGECTTFSSYHLWRTKCMAVRMLFVSLGWKKFWSNNNTVRLNKMKGSRINCSDIPTKCSYGASSFDKMQCWLLNNKNTSKKSNTVFSLYCVNNYSFTFGQNHDKLLGV